MKKLLSLLIVLCIAAFAFAGGEAEAGDDELVIGISTDAGYQARAVEVDGIYQKAEADDNVRVIEQNADNDSTKQTQQIKSMVDQGVDAICVCAVDMNAINTALDYAASKGTIVTTYDRFLDNPNVQFAAGYDSFSDGKACGEWIKSINDGKEHVVFELVGALADTNALARRDGFHSVVDELDNLKVVQIQTDWDTEMALTGVQNALQKYPDVWAIYCASSHMDTSVVTALKEAGRLAKVGEPGHVHYVSLAGALPGYQNAVKGYIDMLYVIPLEAMGFAVYDAIVALWQGEELDQDEYYCPTFPLKWNEVEENKDKIWGYVYQAQ